VNQSDKGHETELRAERFAKQDSAVKSLLECQAYRGDTDGIEVAIMRLGLDYEGALSIVKTLQAALEKRYVDLDDDVWHHFLRLKAALVQAEEPEPDPKAGEDEYMDDNRKW
jgi:hypothetical protein